MHKPTTTEGNVKYDLKQHQEAIADYDTAIELNPKDAQTYNNRGVAKKMLKQYKEAIVDYDKAIELNPKYADSLLQSRRSKKMISSNTKKLLQITTKP